MTPSRHTLTVLVALACAVGVGLPGAAAAKKRKKKAAAAAQASDACGGIVLKEGLVSTGSPLPAAETPSGADSTCIKALAATLDELPGLRTVTVSVKLADAQRAAGLGPKIAKVYSDALVAAGVRESRISAVSPPARHGEEGVVTVTYTQKRSKRPVAVVEGTSGTVSAGPTKKKLEPTQRGAVYPPNTWLRTEAGSTAVVGFADGSRVRLAERTLLKVGPIHLSDELKRVVQLELVEGKMEAAVRSGGEGSVFDVATRTGVAGVRGTEFRVAVGDDTKVETLAGVVELRAAPKSEGAPAGDGEVVVVEAGQGASFDASGKPQAARGLLPAPKVEGPFEGELAAKDALSWVALEGASSYQVELARDAEFAYDLRVQTAGEPTLAPATGLPAAKWYWRVSGVDDGGFVGQPSKVYAFTVKP